MGNVLSFSWKCFKMLYWCIWKEIPRLRKLKSKLQPLVKIFLISINEKHFECCPMQETTVFKIYILGSPKKETNKQAKHFLCLETLLPRWWVTDLDSCLSFTFQFIVCLLWLLPPHVLCFFLRISLGPPHFHLIVLVTTELALELLRTPLPLHCDFLEVVTSVSFCPGSFAILVWTPILVSSCFPWCCRRLGTCRLHSLGSCCYWARAHCWTCIEVNTMASAFEERKKLLLWGLLARRLEARLQSLSLIQDSARGFKG